MVPVKLGLGDPDGGGEIVVGQGRVQDLVAMLGQEVGSRRLASISSRERNKTFTSSPVGGDIGDAESDITKVVTPGDPPLHRPYPRRGKDFGDFAVWLVGS